jgi:hypothetical protein
MTCGPFTNISAPSPASRARPNQATFHLLFSMPSRCCTTIVSEADRATRPLISRSVVEARREISRPRHAAGEQRDEAFPFGGAAACRPFPSSISHHHRKMRMQIESTTQFAGDRGTSPGCRIIDRPKLLGLSVDVEIEARDCPGDYILLNLNEVVFGIGHGQHGQQVLATRDNHQFA